MSGFEALFSFYSLLLGLAMANVATHFGEFLRSRKEMRVGLTPILLGAFILLAATRQWLSLWESRDHLAIEPWQLLVCLGMAMPYIFVSQAMFPRADQQWTSVEDYYLANRAALVGPLSIPALVSLSYNIAKNDDFSFSGGVIASYFPQFFIPLLLSFWGNRWASRIGIGILCLAMMAKLFG